MVKFKGNPLTLEGELIKVGVNAPAFKVTTPDMKALSLKDYQGKVLLISVVPSIDTAVCSLQSKRFDKEAARFPDVQFLTISEDLPFAQGRFAASESCTKMPLASDYKAREFGKKYGLLVKELQLLARAVIIIDKSGKIAYVQLVDEMTTEPDYEVVLKVLGALGQQAN